MKKLLLIFLLSGCAISKYRSPEYFIYKGSEIYHISSEQNTTLLNSSDLKILRIDSLTQHQK